MFRLSSLSLQKTVKRTKMKKINKSFVLGATAGCAACVLSVLGIGTAIAAENVQSPGEVNEGYYVGSACGQKIYRLDDRERGCAIYVTSRGEIAVAR